MEIPIVNEKLYRQIRESLAREGYTFVVAINPESISQLAAGKETASLFGNINPSEKMRSNVPPQIEIAINPSCLKINGSNNLSTDEQIRKIKQQEDMLRKRLPKNVMPFISMIMSRHASILVQLDFEYQKRTRKVLFADWYGRTDDEIIPGHVALVGRKDRNNRLNVFEWYRKGNTDGVFAASVVVLPRKLAV